MKRSEMILNIASELVCEELGFPAFDKAQFMAEIILKRIEKEGMEIPIIYKTVNDKLLGNIPVAFREWEPENETK